MNPVNDIVCNLIETPFSKWKDIDKKDVLKYGRPTDLLSINIKKENKKTGKSYNINFKNTWFTNFNWLCSSTNLQKLFCWPCLLFSYKKHIWNKEGFTDFLNITRSLHKHEDSVGHLKCKLKLKTFEKNNSSTEDARQENTKLYILKYNENVRLNRIFLQLVIDAVLYLNNYGFCTHESINNSIITNGGSNFKELLKLLLKTSSLEIQNQYAKIESVSSSFIEDSKNVQNEIMGCISEYIHDYIKIEINETKFFSIQLDDVTETSRQWSVTIRFVNSEGLLVERFLGFHDLTTPDDDRSSETIFYHLDRILDEFHYQYKLIGASVTSGHLQELQRRMKDKAPQAILVHSLAHHLSLVLQQNFKKISSKCRLFFASVSVIPFVFHHLGKRTHVTDSAPVRRISTVADSKLLSVIIEDWEQLKEVFEIIINDEESDAKVVRLSNSLLDDMTNFEFTFLAIVFDDIFSLIDSLFDVLLKTSLDVNHCILNIESTCDVLKNRTSEQYFTTLFEKTKKITNIITKNRDEIIQNCKSLFYEILDTVLTEINVRFQDYEKLQFFTLIDNTKFEKYTADFPLEALVCLQQCYPQIFTKTQRLKNELCLLYADQTYRYLTTENILRSLHANRDVFEETCKLFALVLTIPSTRLSTERSLSFLKKTRQETPPFLTNVFAQKELLDELMRKQPFYEDIIDKFAALKDRSIDLMYKK